MKVPEGITFHSGKRKYKPGDEVPKSLESFLKKVKVKADQKTEEIKTTFIPDKEEVKKK